ncbi:sugar ABC transporter permease [Thalassospira lucentensis]|uniref:sugar ABC transporter permease n=1 Tax=Thalassospira lucentensis TaxID=168935 RepID=UPI0020CA7690|nr:sugar ABC transporter permease [Thalassospira lucentensis]
MMTPSHNTNTPSATAPPQQRPVRKKSKLGPMARREAKLALWMLAPTFLIVMGIVLFPLLANFWISVKPVTLSDLRPPTAVVSERVRGDMDVAGEEFRIQYRMRNSSQKDAITDITLTDTLPAGVTITQMDPACSLDGSNVTCRLEKLDGGERNRLELTATANADFAANPVSPRDSEPTVTGTSDSILTNNEFTLDNFARIFDSREFWSVLWVTIAYTVFGTLGALVLGLFAAQILNKPFKGRSIIRGLFLFPYVAPVIAVAFTWVILLDPFNGTFNAILQRMNVTDAGINFFGQRAVPIDIFGLTIEFPLALATVIAFEAWRYFPLSFLFILARMQSISSDMYEAAEVDGATPLQQFWHISLPQLLGILSTLFLLRFIWTFNKFDDIFLLTGGAAGTRTLTVDVYEQGFALSNLGAGAAVAVAIFILLLVFAVFYFKFVHREDS